MMSGEMLSFINKVSKLIRDNNEPFGGIQVIFLGDFFQLPPVDSELFAFDSDDWNEIIDYTLILNECYRQTENNLITLLNKIRMKNR